MNKTFVSLIIAVVVIACLLVFQATKTTSSYVLLPSEVASDSQNKSRLRVAGRVADKEINYQTKPTAILSFYISDPPQEGGESVRNNDTNVLKIVYKGLRPDMFAVGRDVIIDGEYKENTLYASSLLTQCPSKYEPPSPEEQYTDGVTQQ